MLRIVEGIAEVGLVGLVALVRLVLARRGSCGRGVVSRRVGSVRARSGRMKLEIEFSA